MKLPAWTTNIWHPFQDAEPLPDVYDGDTGYLILVTHRHYRRIVPPAVWATAKTEHAALRMVAAWRGKDTAYRFKAVWRDAFGDREIEP